MAFCWTMAGFKNYNTKYNRLLEVQSQALSIKKHQQQDTHFTVDYINKLFGLNDKNNIEDENLNKKEIKPSIHDFFLKKIPTHLFQKPKKKYDYFYKALENSKVPLPNNIEYVKSMAELTKDNSYDITTPKATLIQDRETPTTLKRSFTTKKQKRLYEKETICFTAKNEKKTVVSQKSIREEEIMGKKQKFIIRTKTSEDNTVKKLNEKSHTMNYEPNDFPLKTFVIRTRNEKNRSYLPKTLKSTEEIQRIKTEASFKEIESKLFFLVFNIKILFHLKIFKMFENV